MTISHERDDVYTRTTINFKNFLSTSDLMFPKDVAMLVQMIFRMTMNGKVSDNFSKSVWVIFVYDGR